MERTGKRASARLSLGCQSYRWGAGGRGYRAGKGENRGASVECTLGYSSFLIFHLCRDIICTTNGTHLSCLMFQVLIHVYTPETMPAVKVMFIGHHSPSFQLHTFEAIWSCPTDHWYPSVHFSNLYSLWVSFQIERVTWDHLRQPRG